MLEKWIPRLHLAEIEDQRWCPRWLRRYMTDYLQFMSRFTRGPYSTFVIRLRWAMQAMGETRIVDLCTGSGGPIEAIVGLMEKQERYPVTAKLTDLYPNLPALALRERNCPQVQGIRQSVNAMDVPPEIQGFRLICNGFHHFDPVSAKRVLGDAVAKNQGIAVLELVSRSVPGVLSALVGVASMFILTPFVTPFSLGRLFFTYVIPIVPLATLWDGMVSCLRIYSPEEMEALVQPYRDTHYRWELGRLPAGPGPMTVRYLIGYPLKKAGSTT